MGTVLASTIFTDAGRILLDPDATRWTNPERLVYLNAGQVEIVELKPDENAVNDVYKMVAGTKQSIPDGTANFLNASGATLARGLQLIKVTRNMGLTGLAAGSVIAPVDTAVMDAMDPDWHTETASATVKNYMFDERDPRRFYITPPNLGTGYVEAVFSAMPAAIAAAAGPSYAVAITLGDNNQQRLLDYLLYRCYSKDASLSPYNGERAVAHWNLFVQSLGRMDLVQKQYSPNVRHLSPSPSIKAV